jgi:hypothetical protein
MIVYDLICSCGYQFEGWFQDSSDYRRQSETGLLLCPECGGREVHKILSPVVAVNRCQRQVVNPVESAEPLTHEKKVQALLTCLSDYVDKNFEDVGAKLATTALKIHYGVEETRNIRGVATDREKEMLEQEGIQLINVPMLTKTDELN